jgi:hypothetical protein
MTVKELEKYCINEANKWIKRANESTGEEKANCQGKVQTFMWIATKIQNEVNAET